LQGLLTDPFGSKLHNEVAHGLKSDGGFFSGEFVYPWWLFLRYVALTAHLVRARSGDHSMPANTANEPGVA
jgi:hypothetical protein